MTSPTILLLAGSLRSESYTTRLLLAAADCVPATFVAERVDQIRDLPHYDADLDGDDPIPAARAVRSAVAEASGIIIATPEYNGTVPGGLKNWVDWVTRPAVGHVLTGKPVAIFGAAPGSKGAIGAVNWLRTTLGYLGAQIVGEPVAFPAVAAEFDENGRLSDAVVSRLRDLVEALAVAAPES